MNKKTESYMHHYNSLQEISNTVSSGLIDHDIDELMPLISKAMEHYEGIRARIEKFNLLVEQAKAASNEANGS